MTEDQDHHRPNIRAVILAILGLLAVGASLAVSVVLALAGTDMTCRLCTTPAPADAPLCPACAVHPLLVAAPRWQETIQLVEDVGAVRGAGKVALQ